MFEKIWGIVWAGVGIFLFLGLIGGIVAGFQDAFHKHGAINVLVFFAILMLIIIGGLLGHGSHGMLD